jgi:hypothetical protein
MCMHVKVARRDRLEQWASALGAEHSFTDVTITAGCPGSAPTAHRSTKAVMELAMPSGAAARHCGSVTLTASLALGMFAHSMKIFGTVDRLSPARSSRSRGWHRRRADDQARFQQAPPPDRFWSGVPTPRRGIILAGHDALRCHLRFG